MKIVLFNTYIFDNNFIFNIINFCSSLINISNLLIFGLISILSLIFIHMSNKPLLDAAHKVKTTVAAASVIYKNVIKGGDQVATMMIKITIKIKIKIINLILNQIMVVILVQLIIILILKILILLILQSLKINNVNKFNQIFNQ